MRREKLAQLLGLEVTEIIASDTAPLPTLQTGHGFARTPDRFALSELFESSGRQELTSLRMNKSQDLLIDCFEHKPARFLLVFPTPGFQTFGSWSEQQVCFDGPRVALIDFAKIPGKTVVFTHAQGRGVYLTLGEQLAFGCFDFCAPEANSEVALSPIRSWMQEISDEWLIAQLEDILEVESTWSHAVAVGLAARLGHTSTAAERAARVHAMMRGEPAAPDPLSKWASSLEPSVIERLEEQAIATLELLATRIDELITMARREELALPDEPELIDALHERDDVECARWVIQQKSAARRLDRVTPGFDALGSELVALCAALFDLAGDERLRRAVGASASGWWTSLACGAEDEDENAGA